MKHFFFKMLFLGSSSSETKNWLQGKFKLELSPEMMQALLKGNDLILRFLCGCASHYFDR
jgi:hypothetical protein